MKLLVLAFAILSSFPAHGAEIFTAYADKANYSVGEAAVLRASVATKPINSDFEFDVVSTLNGEPLSLDRITDYEHLTSVPGLELGEYSWQVSLVIQDRRYARDLKASILYFDGRIATIDQLLSEVTDPQEISNLNAQKARYQSLKAGAESELANVRTLVQGPVTVTFSAQ